ncbi:MAG: dihydrofolate reductase [Bacteroidia bacterium]|nr:dihydrofolate reductase [Bacteroidia bacterium]
MTLCLIAAVAENLAIGKEGKLPWHLPADLRHFKELTLGSPILMGRKTYESIGRLLPGRANIIISTNADYRVEGATVVRSLPSAIEAAHATGAKQAFLIGGGQLYRQAIDQRLVDLLYITRVHHAFNGDVFFPAIAPAQWTKVAERRNAPDAENPYAYSFETWIPA